MFFYENTDSDEVIKLLGQSISTDIKQKHLKKRMSQKPHVLQK